MSPTHKFGVITDTHVGVRESEKDVFRTLDTLASDFKSRGVDTVLHLGDVAVEEPAEKYQERVSRVADIFDGFEYRMTMGNHDALAVSEEKFCSLPGGVDNTVLTRSDGTSAILVNSAGTGEFSGVGHLGESALRILEGELSKDNDCLVFSHYPLQYTPYFQRRDFFEYRPEYTFPLNKLQLTPTISESDWSVSLVCGHLHPFSTIHTDTAPLNTPLTILEPLRCFVEKDGDVIWSENNEIDVDSLIFEI